MERKPTKKTKATPEYDSERETRVLVEEVRCDVKKIAEGHGSLVKGQQEIKSELESVKVAVMEVDARVKKVEQKVEGIEQKVDGIGQKLDTVISDHENRINTLEAKTS